jgi:hypothetical protein
MKHGLDETTGPSKRPKLVNSVDFLPMDSWGHVATFADRKTFHSILRISQYHYEFNWKPWVKHIWFMTTHRVKDKSRVDYVSRVICVFPKVNVERFQDIDHMCVTIDLNFNMRPEHPKIDVLVVAQYPQPRWILDYIDGFYEYIAQFPTVVLIDMAQIDQDKLKRVNGPIRNIIEVKHARNSQFHVISNGMQEFLLEKSYPYGFCSIHWIQQQILERIK